MKLLSNAKYAFPTGQRGEIHVGLRSEQNRFVLHVRDDGVGLPEGLDFRDTESLGMQLVTTLVRQLDGTIELDRTHGTAFRISFPAS